MHEIKDGNEWRSVISFTKNNAQEVWKLFTLLEGGEVRRRIKGQEKKGVAEKWSPPRRDVLSEAGC